MRPVYLISLTPYPGVIHIPSIAIRFLTPVIDFSQYDGIIVTSKQALKALEEGYDQEWEEKICLCVSEETGKYAEKLGFKEVWNGEGDGLSIARFLKKTDPKIRWLYVRPKKVATSWADEARKAGFSINDTIVYESECIEDGIEIDPYGVLIFTSPSSIECFLKRASILPTHAVIVIGETTRKALPEGVESIVCDVPSIEACVVAARRVAEKD